LKPILEIQNISKKFRINHEQQPYLSLRDSITNIFKNKGSKEDFWALKDVSFDVMPGDTVGIIGKNGAGKSTLLKILSKITPPTSGKIISRGRIASLLEVGTGFHPELSGRENVYMNGSILGMRRAEIQKNFDAIVDFAGIEKFIDTPLKHYSSGMQLRLAFAVAAFLENEILIIDEVLAVGDAEFQKKCMGKMGDISKSGRTILFVSHNLALIEHLCKKGVHLSKAQLINYGASNTVLSNYLKDLYNSANLEWVNQSLKKDKNIVQKIQLKKTIEDGVNSFSITDEISLYIHCLFNEPITNVAFEIYVYSQEGILLFYSYSNYVQVITKEYTAACKIPPNLFNDSTYSISVGVSKDYKYYLHKIDYAITFEVLNVVNNTGWNGKHLGVIRPNIVWETE